MLTTFLSALRRPCAPLAADARAFISTLVIAASLTHGALPLSQPQAAHAQALPTGLVAVADAPVTGLSKAAVNGYLSSIPALALVNEDDQPYFTSSERNTRIAFFFLEPTDALRELKLLKASEPTARLKLTSLDQVYFNLVMGSTEDLGGTLRIRPSRRQVVEANRALQYAPSTSLLPVTLDEAKGQVPVFYSERVVLSLGGVSKYPFFFRKEDLDTAFRRTEAAAALAKSSSRGGAPEGLPSGLVRVATLDGLVKQMQSGEVDLTDALLVPSPQALLQARELVGEE
eukprot:CAMPEP_0183355274 /NCGR_PEP_ID=MMETSP0164_2-20130417/39705_1 /TAXON_ID=221442 /ORGANISM="Coccolithus pelagicus ssp braarudi, Strain PLY182g" /LENGTH=286 /DNA_ID=CAMNT_0025528325 /DNA_START=1 /DNA_END=861 /DNA_ORIENTATION=+